VIVGKSEAIKEVKEKIKLVAPSSIPVLVLGETGVGKELVADELHRQSARIRNKLVKVNCAAIQDSLLESELFGHVKGAFTDASTRKLGKLHIADQGTLVLDEISNMSWAVQAKILRVVENQQFEMVGGTESFHINTRFISLSNKDMITLINQNKFRDDLFYRLNTTTIQVPTLRDRLEDIPLLVKHYVTIFRERYNKQRTIKSFSKAAIEKLQHYLWPGNIRELKSVLEQAVLFCFDDQIKEDHILFHKKDAVLASTIPTDTKKLITHTVEHLSTNGYTNKMTEALEDIELEWILRSLKKTGFVQKAAACELGISKSKLHYKLQRYRERTGKEIGHGIQTIQDK